MAPQASPVPMALTGRLALPPQLQPAIGAQLGCQCHQPEKGSCAEMGQEPSSEGLGQNTAASCQLPEKPDILVAAASPAPSGERKQVHGLPL